MIKIPNSFTVLLLVERENRICSLCDESKQVVYDDNKMATIVRSFFQRLFASNSASEMSHVLSGITPCITDEINQKLDAPYTKEEVVMALRELEPLKASGMMVCQYYFFKSIGMWLVMMYPLLFFTFLMMTLIWNQLM